MADDKHYVPGDYYRIDDRTGFKVRAGRTRKEWTGMIVRDQSWEPRQPQDLVQGVRDDQNAPEPRPPSVSGFLGPLCTTVTATTPTGGILVQVTDTERMFIGDDIGIILDNGEMFRTKIGFIYSTTWIDTLDLLPWSTSSGNDFVNYSAVSLPSLYDGIGYGN